VEENLPDVLNRWLQLLLLHGGNADLQRALLSQQQQQQQQEEEEEVPDSLGAGSAASPMVTLDSSHSHTIGVLLALLEPLSYFGSAAVWMGRLPGVLLLLEVLMRRLGPLVALSSSSSSSSSSGVNAGAVQLFDQCLLALSRLTDSRSESGAVLYCMLLQRQKLAQQQQQQSEKQEQLQQELQQLRQLWRQYHAVAGTFLKLCRSPGCLWTHQYSMVVHLVVVSMSLTHAESPSHYWFWHGMSFDEWGDASRMDMEPWLVLVGQYFYMVGTNLAASWAAAAAAAGSAGFLGQGACGARLRNAVNDTRDDLRDLGRVLGAIVGLTTAWGQQDNGSSSSPYAAAAAGATSGVLLLLVLLLLVPPVLLLLVLLLLVPPVLLLLVPPVESETAASQYWLAACRTHCRVQS
jgi:hypothetical protein